MNAPFSTPAATSVVPRALRALTCAALVSLLLILPAASRAAHPVAPPRASVAASKSRFDRLSVNSIHGGVLVRGSILTGFKHLDAKVSLLLRRGSQGRFKRVETAQLAAYDRNFALLAHLSPGRWSVEVRFTDPGHETKITSPARSIGVPSLIGFPMTPGSLKVSAGLVTYSGSIPHPKSVTQVQLLGLDLGPIKGTSPFHPAAPGVFNVLATTTAGTGTGSVGFTLQAHVKRGERWAFVLKRSFGHLTGIDYAGLRAVGVR